MFFTDLVVHASLTHTRAPQRLRNSKELITCIRWGKIFLHLWHSQIVQLNFFLLLSSKCFFPLPRLRCSSSSQAVAMRGEGTLLLCFSPFCRITLSLKSEWVVSMQHLEYVQTSAAVLTLRLSQPGGWSWLKLLFSGLLPLRRTSSCWDGYRPVE